MSRPLDKISDIIHMGEANYLDKKTHVSASAIPISYPVVFPFFQLCLRPDVWEGTATALLDPLSLLRTAVGASGAGRGGRGGGEEESWPVVVASSGQGRSPSLLPPRSCRGLSAISPLLVGTASAPAGLLMAL